MARQPVVGFGFMVTSEIVEPDFAPSCILTLYRGPIVPGALPRQTSSPDR